MNYVARANRLLEDARQRGAGFAEPVYRLNVLVDGTEHHDLVDLDEPEVEGRLRGFVYRGFNVTIQTTGSIVEVSVREPNGEIAFNNTSILPLNEIKAIVEVVRAQTQDVVVAVEDHESGVLVKTGVLHGHHWRLRKGSAEWKVIQRTQWCT